jgi:hypothetical protein
MCANDLMFGNQEKEKIKCIRKRFKNAVKCGTGETHLLMRDHPQIDFSNDIIKAALKNLSYDNQCEGSRATYVFELIQLSHKKEKIRQAVLKALSTEREDAYALDQLFDIAVLFAKQGDEEAKRAIYRRFYKKTIEGSEWIGQDAILSMDGIEGLKHIAKIKGKIMQNDPEEWEDSFLIDQFQEENSTIDVYKELEKAGISNKYIKTYIDIVRKHKVRHQKCHKKRSRPRYNYDMVSRKINSLAIVPLHSFAAKELSEDDVKKLADDFLAETDRLRLEKYMRVFDLIKFPYDYQPILMLAKGKNRKRLKDPTPYQKYDRLVEYACGALRFFSGTDIRRFAISKLKGGKHSSDYLGLLVSNYKKGDSKLLEDIIVQCKNEDVLHSLVFGIIDIYEANKTKECKKPLEAMYGKLNCGIHREDIIKILIENNVLSSRLKDEIKFDSYEDVRELLNV